MIKKLIAVLLILIGVVGVAGGIWGLSLQIGNDIDPAVAQAALTVLHSTDDVVSKIDGTISEWTNGSATLTGLLNSLTGNSVDLGSNLSVTWFAMGHALEILFAGIILIQTGLLIFAFDRR